MSGAPAPVDLERWLDALWRRHLAELTFPEVRRAVQALSDLYLHRRSRLERGAALDGAGKRAAFAIYFGPLHLIAVGRIVAELGAAIEPPSRVLDLGCGTGAAGAGWALAAGGTPRLVGVDRSPWALGEAQRCWRALGLRGETVRGDLVPAAVGRRGDALVAGWAVNELAPDPRAALLLALLRARRAGSPVLVVEPIARRPVPWWDEWAAAFVELGGRNDAWRFEVELPEPLRRMDRAAGLDHAVLKARSLYAP